jgi:hypothetical protein
MALSYEQSAGLMKDVIFRDRVQIACINFARYITDEAPSVTAHSTRIKWAQQTLVSPEPTVNQVIPTVVTDAAVQADGAAVTDAQLQTAVETSVNKLL